MDIVCAIFGLIHATQLLVGIVVTWAVVKAIVRIVQKRRLLQQGFSPPGSGAGPYYANPMQAGQGPVDPAGQTILIGTGSSLPVGGTRWGSSLTSGGPGWISAPPGDPIGHAQSAHTTPHHHQDAPISHHHSDIQSAPISAPTPTFDAGSMSGHHHGH